MRELGVDVEFVQDNHSRSVRGHHARAPLPAPARARRSWSAPRAGAICDVAVDLRRDSPTYGQYEASS